MGHCLIEGLSTLCLCLSNIHSYQKKEKEFSSSKFDLAPAECFSLYFGCVTLFLAGEDLPQDLQMRSKQRQVSRKKKVKVFSWEKH